MALDPHLARTPARGRARRRYDHPSARGRIRQPHPTGRRPRRRRGLSLLPGTLDRVRYGITHESVPPAEHTPLSAAAVRRDPRGALPPRLHSRVRAATR
ncbi:hypothetical protein PLANTIT3_60974 [Plantibacter sp. T3]|nr:hypothetical protein PLANTIT3_60974 [Plantibacter sp. T3]